MISINSNRLPIPLVFFLTLWVAIAFSPGLTGDFFFDDYKNIVINEFLHIEKLNWEQLTHAAYSFQPGFGSRPLSMLSFALNIWTTGLDPYFFKLTNLAIHITTTLALIILFCEILRVNEHNDTHAPYPHPLLISSILALAWAIHPMQVSSVLYIVQRMQTLVTLFMVLSLIFYLKMRMNQIQGQSGRLQGLLTVLFAIFGLASKEDAILLPAYTLALELTVLRFRAMDTAQEQILRRIYSMATVVAMLAYVFIVIPKHWHWEAYPGRMFSTPERLWTQGRVLLMYLGQMLWPHPNHFHFFYDDIEISRGWFQPFNTFISALVLLGLLSWAWWARIRRPLFAFGIFLFFTGHFITCNVINLELVFEHRNHLPLIGITLATGDGLKWLLEKPIIKNRILPVAFIISILILLTASTLFKSYNWGDNDRMALDFYQMTPRSERALVLYSEIYYQRSKYKKDHPDLLKAIELTNRAIQTLPNSVALSANQLVYKTAQGIESNSDWQRVHDNFKTAPMSSQNKLIFWGMIDQIQEGYLHPNKWMESIIKSVIKRININAHEYLRLAVYFFNHTESPEKAYPYLEEAVLHAKPGDPNIDNMLQEMETLGKTEWVAQLKALQSHKTYD